jgi:hypothetical protein
MLASTQRVICFDIDSDHSPGSKDCAKYKEAVTASAHAAGRKQVAQVVHASISHTYPGSYRPGTDVSFPAALPDAFGDEVARSRPPSSRATLFCFRGRPTHPMREAIFRLHNGDDQLCIDSGKPLLELDGEGSTNPYDGLEGEARRFYIDEYVSAHAHARFSLCPRGDAPYSFRMIEALSCGAIPVIYGDGWVLPFSEILDYRAFAVCIAEADVEQTASILRAIPIEAAERMQAAGRRAFAACFCTLEVQLQALLRIIREHTEAAIDGSKPRAADEEKYRFQVVDVLARESRRAEQEASSSGKLLLPPLLQLPEELEPDSYG